MLCPPEALDGEIGRFRPHLVVLDDNGAAAPDGMSGALYRVEILLGASMDARISVDGRAREVKNICMEDLLAVVDEAKKRQSSNPSCLRATPLLPPLRLCH